MKNIFLVLIIPTFLLGCERDPRTVAMERAAENNAREETAREARMSRLEGQTVHLGVAGAYGTFHLREDCPKINRTKWDGKKSFQVDLVRATIRKGRVVDTSGFYHDDRNPCDRCVP